MEAYETLLKFPNGQRDLSWRRIGIFEELCSDSHSNSGIVHHQHRKMDPLFSSEEGPLTFKTFRKFDNSDMDEECISNLTRLDTVIKDTVDSSSLLIITRDVCAGEECKFKDEPARKKLRGCS